MKWIAVSVVMMVAADLEKNDYRAASAGAFLLACAIALWAA